MYKEKGIQKTCETCKYLKRFNEGYFCNHNSSCIRGYIYPEKLKFTDCELWEWNGLEKELANETNGE